jgi:site-specific DNA-methyltransferase (adenine-specific)
VANKLYYGDNLDVLRNKIKDETVDLCYIDPPFNSKRNYFQIYNNIGEEDRAQAQAFVDTWEWGDEARNGYEQIITNHQGRFTKQTIELLKGFRNVLGEGSLLAYLVSITLRIAEIQRVLKPTGSFYLHCDPTASHYLKLVLDAVFCGQGGEFRNEIVWCYRGAGYPKKDFGRRHDIIFRYSKTGEFTFNLDDAREEYAETTKERFSHYIGNVRGKRDFGSQKLNPLGRQPDDWWQIQPIAPSAKERLGYPTQKPETLLEKIIKASSNTGDLILDAYCGCGTTVAVAERLKRRWIGIDITYQSISLILRRLEDTFDKAILPNVTLDGIPQDMASAQALAHKKDDRVRKEFEKWAVLTYSNNRAIINTKKGADKGLDGIAYFVTANEETDKAIFQVKSESVNRSTIATLRGDMERENAPISVLITLEEPTKPMREEAKAAGTYKHKLMERAYDRVQIVTVREIIEQGKRMDLPLSVEVVKAAQASQDEGEQGELL